ncbi:hypothetical protein I3843_01G079300 [Carya illinoinensis]|nr:hypothetical protein I3843_01G079300 [Carya illinoinensis]KAG7994846.1 hypothetical protein I3843_01G079300 [Carya illinoinensis]
MAGMDPIIYEAAAKGNLEALEQCISDPLDGFLTVNKNTIIHICISSILVEEDSHAVGGTDPASAANFVKVLLDRCPRLLLKANAECDTPLHVAARYGHASIVKVLIEHQKSQHQDLESGVVEATTEIESGDLESGVVETTTEIESGVVEATTEMIGKPNKERDTALHEAVRHNHIEVVKQLLMEVDPEFPFGANVAGMTKNILERYGRNLCKQADRNGWTPLHMAAYVGRTAVAKLLLKYDREVAYIQDAEGRTALHIAACCDKDEVTKAIISMCPDCCEVVDNEGRNALHLAIRNNLPRAALIIQNNSSLRNLLNQKDNDGNTPLHYYCNSNFVCIKHVLNSPRVDKMVFNKENHNASQILESRNLPVEDFVVT